MKEQLRKDLLDLDAQIFDLETIYLEATKEAVCIYSRREILSKVLTTTLSQKLQEIRLGSKNKK